MELLGDVAHLESHSGTFGDAVSVVHDSCTDQNELPVGPRHQGVQSGVSKTISEPNVCLAYTVQLSCTDTNNVSKRTEMTFHKTHVT
jgi:hypothetical protein